MFAREKHTKWNPGPMDVNRRFANDFKGTRGSPHPTGSKPGSAEVSEDFKAAGNLGFDLYIGLSNLSDVVNST